MGPDRDSGDREPTTLSIVAPVFNEQQVLPEFHRRVGEALAGLDFELICVDDGSDDGSAERLEAIAATDPRTRVITLSRNFGDQAAITAGLDHARGDVIVMIDADLQDPPGADPDHARPLAPRLGRRLRRAHGTRRGRPG